MVEINVRKISIDYLFNYNSIEYTDCAKHNIHEIFENFI